MKREKKKKKPTNVKKNGSYVVVGKIVLIKSYKY